jgi:hypothetical protein
VGLEGAYGADRPGRRITIDAAGSSKVQSLLAIQDPISPSTSEEYQVVAAIFQTAGLMTFSRGSKELS